MWSDPSYKFDVFLEGALIPVFYFNRAQRNVVLYGLQKCIILKRPLIKPVGWILGQGSGWYYVNMAGGGELNPYLPKKATSQSTK